MAERGGERNMGVRVRRLRMLPVPAAVARSSKSAAARMTLRHHYIEAENNMHEDLCRVLSAQGLALEHESIWLTIEIYFEL